MRRFTRFPTTLGNVAIAAYLSFLAYAALQQVRGDSAASPALYFATWDMFPFYDTESARLIVMGRDASGQWWQLAPGPLDRFRWGVYGQATRYDLDRRPETVARCAEKAVLQMASAADAVDIREVLVAERFWPVRRNRFGSEGAGLAAEPAARQPQSWRIVRRGRVNAAGRIDWDVAP